MKYGRPAQQSSIPASHGFTLIEVMVALAIVSIVLIPLLSLHLRSLDTMLRAQDLMRAVMLAQEKIASIPAKPEPGETQGAFDNPVYDRFHWQIVVGETEEVALGESPHPFGVQRIEVTVWWEDRRPLHSFKLESYRVD